MPGLDKHKLEDLEEGLAMHLAESELNEKSISVLELTMTYSEVSKHPMENKLAVDIFPGVGVNVQNTEQKQLVM